MTEEESEIQPGSGLKLTVILYKNGALIEKKVGKSLNFYHKHTIRETMKQIEKTLFELWEILNRG